MKKRFTTLRCALMENGTTQHALAHDLGLSPSCLSKRFTGKVPWTTQEAYSVLRLLNRPDSELQLYFPRDGVSKSVHGCELNKETLTKHQLEPFPRATSGRHTRISAPVMLGAATPDKRMLLADYSLNWLETFKRGKIRPSSYERYQFCLQLLCKDEIAHLDIREIRLEHVQGYVNRLEDMSASTIKKQKLLLSQVLEHAVLTEVILRNPVQGVQMPAMSHNTRLIFPYEKDEQEKLVAAFTEEKNVGPRLRYGFGCVLILETGLRAGEALALEWSDIDEERRLLKVSKNMVRVDGKNLVHRATKTASGKRTIPLNTRAMEAVQHLKAQQVEGCPFVFATQTGEHVSYRHLLATMEKACDSANVEHRGLHALRHSFASNLYARGVEIKVISKLLGHASTQITYDRYVHLFEGDLDDTLRQAVGA